MTDQEIIEYLNGCSHANWIAAGPYCRAGLPLRDKVERIHHLFPDGSGDYGSEPRFSADDCRNVAGLDSELKRYWQRLHGLELARANKAEGELFLASIKIVDLLRENKRLNLAVLFQPDRLLGEGHTVEEGDK